MTAARKLDERPALTVAEVARLLGAHPRTIRREAVRKTKTAVEER